MTFIRKRVSSRKGDKVRFSCQLIETYRENGKVKQRVLVNLGRSPTITEALRHARKNLAFWTHYRDKRAAEGKNTDTAIRAIAKTETNITTLESVVSKKRKV